MALLGTMFTLTTYGTWLRGDRRGWVDDGKILPADPELEAADRVRMKHDMFRFALEDLSAVGTFIGLSLQSRLQQRVLALTVQTWHVHFVVASSPHLPPVVVKCAKEAVRYGLKPKQPIWTDEYDKRYCFEDGVLQARIAYVERHNTAMGLSPRPWPFIEDA
jgi:hypothetical protein